MAKEKITAGASPVGAIAQNLPGNLTGATFGKLSVVRRSVGGRSLKSSYWLCRCACGSEAVYARTTLLVNSTISCGCTKRQRVRVAGGASGPCSVAGCAGDTSKGGKGMCGMHRMRVRRYGDAAYTTPHTSRRENASESQRATRPASPKSYLKLLGRHEHRRVMEAHIGRLLTSKEIVHHIDGNKHNNALENLQIMSRREHALIHAEDMQYYGRLHRNKTA